MLNLRAMRAGSLEMIDQYTIRIGIGIGIGIKLKSPSPKKRRRGSLSL
jgi:hypothetical protein